MCRTPGTSDRYSTGSTHPYPRGTRRHLREPHLATHPRHRDRRRRSGPQKPIHAGAPPRVEPSSPPHRQALDSGADRGRYSPVPLVARLDARPFVGACLTPQLHMHLSQLERERRCSPKTEQPFGLAPLFDMGSGWRRSPPRSSCSQIVFTGRPSFGAAMGCRCGSSRIRATHRPRALVSTYGRGEWFVSGRRNPSDRPRIAALIDRTRQRARCHSGR